MKNYQILILGAFFMNAYWIQAQSTFATPSHGSAKKLMSGSIKQKLKRDSLEATLKSGGLDTNRAKTLYRLCNDYRSIDPVKALNYGKDALKLSIELNFQRGIGASYNNLGTVFEFTGDDESALKYYMKSLEIKEKLGDKKSLAATYNNIGTLYRRDLSFEKAIYYLNKSRESASNGINPELYYSSGFNLAIVLKQLNKDEEKAIGMIQEFLNYSISKEDSNQIVNAITSLIPIYIARKDFERAKRLIDSALVFEHSKEIMDFHLASAIGTYYQSIKDSEKAEEFLKRAFNLEKDGEAYDKINQAAYDLYELYNERYKQNHHINDLENAKYYLEIAFNKVERFSSIKKSRSISDIAFKQSIAKKQEELELVSQEKDLSEIKAARYRQTRNVIILCCAVLGLLLYIIFKRLRINQKLNKELSLKNEEIELKNKEILDSIHYAKRIQKVLITSEKQVEKLINKSKGRK